MKFTRRDFLKYAGTTGIVLASGASWSSVRRRRGNVAYPTLDPTNPDNFTRPLRVPGKEGVLGVLDVPAKTITIEAKPEPLEIVPGVETNVLVYRADYEGRRCFNPIFRAGQGSDFAATLVNHLDEETITHWHGLSVPWEMDGHPVQAIGPDESYDYNFRIQNRAANFWYHPHPHELTGKQSYLGLASLFLVNDADELGLQAALDLNLGETDIPLLLQDKQLDAAGNLVYEMAPDGYFGNVIAVNLSVTPFLEVDTRVYRFRVLNGSNARIYRLAFERGKPLPCSVIGTDGGLLERPQEASELFLSPAERADILVDLRDASPGDVIFLKSLAFDPVTPAGGHGGAQLPHGAAFYVLKLVVRNRVAYDRAIPKALSSIVPIDTSEASERLLPLFSAPGGVFTINGWVYQMDEFPVTVARDTVEIWTLRNLTQQPHPMHIHSVPFQVLERRSSPPRIRELAVDRQGRLVTDLGWKDTVLVWPAEEVRIAIRFDSAFPGEQTSLFHCHNLEHEDMGMMINYKIV